MSRLISIIIVLALFLAFIVLNMDNKTDISFGLVKFSEIPVFVSVLFAFVLGMLFSLPFGIALSRRLKKNVKAELPAPAAGKKKFWGKGKDKDKNKDKNKEASDSAAQAGDEINKDSSPYGID